MQERRISLLMSSARASRANDNIRFSRFMAGPDVAHYLSLLRASLSMEKPRKQLRWILLKLFLGSGGSLSLDAPGSWIIESLPPRRRNPSGLFHKYQRGRAYEIDD